MNAVVQPKRLSNAHVREMYQLIAHGQEKSRVAVVDPFTGVAWTLGKGSEKHAAIDHQTLGAFASVLFAPDHVSESKRKQVQELCAGLGRISMIAIPMKDRDLFIGRLANTSRVLILVISHTNNIVSSDTIVRARAIRARMGAPKMGEGAGANQQTTRSYSIWKSLVQAVSARFSKAGSTHVVSSGILSTALSFDHHVLASELFDLETGQHLDQYHHENFPKATVVDSRAASAALVDLFNGNLDVNAVLKYIGFADADVGKVQVQIGDLDFYWLRVPYFPTLSLPFDRDWALLLYKEPRANPALDWAAIDHAGLNLLRLRISLMLEGGLKTTVEPFPETQVEFQRILDELALLDHNDLTTRLQVGGFLREPKEIAGVMQRCQECIYYLPHRKWCDLPELPVPVEPNWWCRLWKV